MDILGRFNSSLPLEGAVGGKIHFSLVSSFFFCPVEIPCAALPGPGAEAVSTAEGSE